MIQAIGGSMLNPVAMSIVTNVYTEPKDRARAIGWWGGVAGISIAAGPLIGGLLVQAIDWRAVFWVNIPVGIAAMLLTQKFVPESKAPHPRRLDPVGQVLMILTLGLLVFGIIEAPNHGWGSDLILGCFAGAAICGALLVYFELRHPEPLIDLRFFRSPPFSGAAIVSICAFLSLGGFLFLNTLYLQDVRGYSPLHAGVALLPMAALMMVVSPLSGRLVGIRGPRFSLVGRRHRDAGRRARLGDPGRRTERRPPLPRLRAARHRARLGERGDHQHRRLRDAARAGGSRRRRRLDDAAARLGARRRDHRLGDRRPRHQRRRRTGVHLGGRGSAGRSSPSAGS